MSDLEDKLHASQQRAEAAEQQVSILSLVLSPPPSPTPPHQPKPICCEWATEEVCMLYVMNILESDCKRSATRVCLQFTSIYCFASKHHVFSRFSFREYVPLRGLRYFTPDSAGDATW